MRHIDAVPVAVAIAAVAVPAFVVLHPPTIRHRAIAAVPRAHVVPQAEVPIVEPVRFVDLTPDEARAYNADIPFSPAPRPAARPFHYAGGVDDLARARDCMATAVLYEAGDDTTGERAVAQVVLNRLRHPAFPKTVCGVIFEGQERSMGCQFSFSCDGAVQRWHPSDAAWTRARQVADAALSGAVYRPVGYATHYHTDWLVPYWQASLDKIAAVNTHLFFRWSGWWGTPSAFNRHQDGHEPMIAQLAPLSEAHRPDAGQTDTAALAEAWLALGFVEPASKPGMGTNEGETAGTDSLLVTLPQSDSPEDYPARALKACGDRPSCRYLAWTDRSRMATALPLTDAQITALAFSYTRDRTLGFETMAWNCRLSPRADPTQCIRQPVVRSATPAQLPAGSAELGGIRRRSASGMFAQPLPAVRAVTAPPRAAR